MSAIVIGGGIYGAAISIYLARTRGIKNIRLIEQESALLTRASINNQARIHNGYHYPRSFVTGHRCRVNAPQFINDWPKAVYKDFKKIYAIAKQSSKVTAQQFEHFCKQIGVPIRPVSKQVEELFEPRLVEKIFEVEEYAFNAKILAESAVKELASHDVEVIYHRRVNKICKHKNGMIILATIDNNAKNHDYQADIVFNCTYGGLNHFKGDMLPTEEKLTQEITEIGLLSVPKPLQKLGITVMDGPFFSTMPFPAKQLHSIYHVRYSRHMTWTDDPHIDPYEKLKHYDCKPRVDRMLNDASRYLPIIGDSVVNVSFFELRTILARNKSDDGRPILFHKHPELPGMYSVLGGKVDNIYDVIEKLDHENFQQSYRSPS
ncbi:MAG: FAD-dependent oxidoreductase [Pseudomonadota bacterium]